MDERRNKIGVSTSCCEDARRGFRIGEFMDPCFDSSGLAWSIQYAGVFRAPADTVADLDQ